jgi:hypothetical protein
MSFDLKQIKDALAPLKMSPEDANATIQEIGGVLQKKISELPKDSNNPTIGSILNGISLLSGDAPLRKSLQDIIARHVPPGTESSAVGGAANILLKGLSGPGFSVKGPVSFGVPIGYAYFKADTSRSTALSSDASAIGLGKPATLRMVGPTLIPAGVISDIASPAAGALLAHDGESSSVSLTVAARPYLDTGIIGTAGVATVKGGLHVGGFDLTADGGWWPGAFDWGLAHGNAFFRRQLYEHAAGQARCPGRLR